MDDASQPSLPQADAKYLLSALDRMDSVFGIFYEPAGYEAAKNTDGGGGNVNGEEELPEVMAELLAKRLAARESKDWATADAVRDEIKALGYAVKVRGLIFAEAAAEVAAADADANAACLCWPLDTAVDK